MSSDYEYVFRCIVVGDSGVGKTSLCKDFCEGRCSSVHEETIGIEFYSKVVTLDTSSRKSLDAQQYTKQKVKIQIWDTAGMERFKPIIRAYYRGVSLAFIVYDCTLRDSFRHVKDWLADVRQMCDENVIIMLVHNKSDLHLRSQVDPSEGKTFSDANDLLFCETSARNNIGVDLCFRNATRALSDRFNNGIELPRQFEPLLLSEPLSKSDRLCNCCVV